MRARIGVRRKPRWLHETSTADLDSVAHALLIDDALEMCIVEAMCSVSLAPKMSLVEIAEQLAKLRNGRASLSSPSP